MELTLNTLRREADWSMGEMLVNNDWLCWTLEDAVREVDFNGDGRVDVSEVAKFKVKGETAIPSGRYRVTLENSPKYGPNTMTINEVPGFTYIRIHPGNSAVDTEGCLLLGMDLEQSSGRIKGGTSKPAVEALKAKVMKVIAAGESVWLTINRG